MHSDEEIIDLYFEQSLNCLPPFYELNVSLPAWCVDYFKRAAHKTYNNDAERMKIAVELSDLNVKKQTGGPFGAAVFNLETGDIVSVGVNRVVPQSVSCAHAEVMALSTAQKRIGSFDLSAGQGGQFGLYSSSQPCIMCLGACLWSGIKLLACGARGHEDVEFATGFDEGPVPEDWVEQCRRRGIEVVCDLLRDQACDVLKEYAATGIVYNPGVQSGCVDDFSDQTLETLFLQTESISGFAQRACKVFEIAGVKTVGQARQMLGVLKKLNI